MQTKTKTTAKEKANIVVTQNKKVICYVSFSKEFLKRADVVEKAFERVLEESYKNYDPAVPLKIKFRVGKLEDALKNLEIVTKKK